MLNKTKAFRHQYQALKRIEQQISNINHQAPSPTMVTTFSLMAIFLACLGLLGLAAYSAVQRVILIRPGRRPSQESISSVR